MQISEYANKKLKAGFTLVELLVVISIIGVLIGLSVFGLQGARQASRDSKRKADLESLRSGVEIYKSDCNTYPIAQGDPTVVLATNGTSLAGSGSPTSCAISNVYISQIPQDPTSPNKNYLYYSDGVTYEICTSLEQDETAPAVSCGGSINCGSVVCNYKVVNP